MNTFMNNLKEQNNYTYTENGAITHKSTLNAVLDMFALGGSYRKRSDADCITLFKSAAKVDATLALKCLFYLRDVRGGQGERRFFRTCYHWLANEYPEIALRNMKLIPEYGRYDDLFCLFDTVIEKEMLAFIKEILALDLDCKCPSLLAKWLPSENASSIKTKKMGTAIRKYLRMTHKQYRKTLSILRAKINVVERLMSENRWDEIEFDKIPSRAGMIYKNAFARRDMIKEKYKEFAKDTTTTVNATTLYPYDIAHQAFASYRISDTNRAMIQKYWDNLPNYYGDKPENGLAIVDVSGSMSGRPMEAAVSLGAYIAEKAHGPFAGHFVTFSQNPQLVEFKGVDIVDKFQRATRADWGMNTNLKAVFDMLLRTAQRKDTRKEDIPTRLYIFSDMEFDSAFRMYGDFAEHQVNSLLESIAEEWRRAGYELPEVVFWNLDARNDNIPAMGGRFSYVSGLSPVMIETILSGKTGIDLMLEKLNSERYAAIHA